MTVSEIFCRDNMKLLLKILNDTSDHVIRNNIVIALGDIAICFHSCLEENMSMLFKRLRDENVNVKKSTLMVLMHLILNGIIKIKGQIAEISKCIVDSEEEIRDMAKLFFTELALKDNVIYNNMADLISCLINKEMNENNFKTIVKFLFAFVKDKQSDNLIEKLCYRFKDIENTQEERMLSFCLSILNYNTTKSLTKLTENLPFYKNKLKCDVVYKHFVEIVSKLRKCEKVSSADLEEYSMAIEQFHNRFEEVKIGNLIQSINSIKM
jgi:condensin complex subunit 1